MIGQSYLPCPALRQYARRYQLWHFTFSDVANLPFKPYAPRPEQALGFCPRGYELVEYVADNRIIRKPPSYIMGQFAERTNRHIGTSDFITILVNFHPGILFRVTGIPYHELTNTFIDAEIVFGKRIRLVNERLSSTGNYSEMIAIVEQFLLDVFQTTKNDAHPLDALADSIIRHPENSRITQLAKDSFLCTRQFERKFKERMGVSPKLFTRIARANKVFQTKYLYPDRDWLRAALECGYHDYQHLAKDFIDFAGVTPAEYLLQDEKNAPERLFGARDSSLISEMSFSYQ
ncbi:MAG: AraC family transcriptional regulator [Chitinophagaceae bacterium]|nr:AraC family transcriptional regulator [Chitinophagaceae bacterium]